MLWGLVFLCGTMLAFPAHGQDSSEMHRLVREAVGLTKKGQFELALPLATRAVALGEKLFGSEHVLTGLAINILCEVRSGLKDNVEALRLAERALPILEKALGDDPVVASLLGVQGRLYFLKGDNQRARPALERAVAINEKCRGRDDPSSAHWLYLLSELQQEEGHYDVALDLNKRGVIICRKQFGEEHPQYARVLLSLGHTYTLKRQYAEAVPLMEQAVAVYRKTLGLEHLETLFAMSQLAAAQSAKGDHARAASLLMQLTDLRLKVLGEDDPRTLFDLSQLANELSALGDARAESAYQRVIAIGDRKWGPENQESARNIVALAAHHTRANHHAQARVLLERAVSIWQKLEPGGMGLAGALTALSSACYSLGDYSSAEKHAQPVLGICAGQEALLESPTTPEQRAYATYLAVALVTLSNVCVVKGDMARALPLLERSLQIHSKMEAPLHPMVLSTSLSLARVLISSDLPRARRLLESAAALVEQGHKVDPALAALVYADLAVVCSLADDSRSAQKWGLAAASRVQELPRSNMAARAAVGVALSSVLLRSGDCKEAIPVLRSSIEIGEFCYGSESSLLAGPLEMLAVAYADLEQRDEALQFQGRADAIRDRLLGHLFSFSTPEERLAVESALIPYVVYASLGEAPSVTASILRRKGLALDASLVERDLLRRGTSEQLSRIDRLRILRNRLRTARPLAAGEVDPLSREERVTLEKQADEIEKSISRDFADRGSLSPSLGVTVGAVQHALPAGSAVVEFIRYRHLLGRGCYEDRYGAAVVLPTGSPVWVSLGRAADIDELVRKYQASMHRDKDDDAAVAAVLRGLYDRVWKPVVPLLPPSTQRVLVSPDDALNLVSFATLLGPDDRFVGEHLAVAYVASGRDILRPTRRCTNSELAILADPTFSEALPGGASRKGGGRRLPASTADNALTFAPLPGTAAEVDALTTLAASAGLKSRVLRGRQATKGALAQLQSPRWLHLATHGFFLPGATSATSGLALAGAQATIEAWQRGEQVPVENDGIVTSEEVAFLDLSGTELVVLSACDTGVGKVVPGEGVLGLKRAFVQAGARNLLITLWPVHDNSTAVFMRDFYGRLLKGESPATSLSAVQREWLSALRKKEGLHRAVVAGGPFIVTIQGPP